MALIADEELAEAILAASRAMVGIAVQSLAGSVHEVTLPQYRTLVALTEDGTIRLADLAATLQVSPSTATRMCDRLVRKALVTRVRDEVDRREVNLVVTDAGRSVVRDVIERRRSDLRHILKAIPDEARPQLIASLQLLAAAADESPEMHWAPGWHSADESVPAGV
ncbi:MAG TPA: MarR family transcriptional regulator [Acidimicrobiales bacterium]|nr:MarR family transcriptional regulator [Acidimicrobiales bacterium]